MNSSLQRGTFCHEIITAWLFAALLLQSATAVAPDWWAARSVLTSGSAADDYAVANIGQLKNLAKKAAQEMNSVLPGGAGAEINFLIAAWEAAPVTGVTRDDYAAVNLGQLKSVARRFYDRLTEVGTLTEPDYPWNSGDEQDDFVLANLGQLKATFAFDIAFTDSDNDGMADAWEMLLFASLAQGAQDDFDLDGISNLAEKQAGTRADSNDSDNDGFSDQVESDNGFDPKSAADNPDARGYETISLERTMRYGYESGEAWQEQPYDKPLPTYAKSWYWYFNDDQDDAASYGLLAMPAVPPAHDLSPPGNFPPAGVWPSQGNWEENMSYLTGRNVIASALSYADSDERGSSRASEVLYGAVRLRSLYPRTRPVSKQVLITRETFTLTAYGGANPAGTEYEIITLELPANATISAPAVIAAPVTAGQMELVEATPIFAEIVPDESMYDPLLAGGLAPPLFLSMSVAAITAFNNPVRGDEIPSVLPNGDKHFVTPKKTEKIPQTYVILRAKNASTSDFGPNGKLEWHFKNPDAQDVQAHPDYAQVDPQDPLKVNVSRLAPRHVIVSIGPKNGNPDNDKIKMHVWVVWTTITPDAGGQATVVLAPTTGKTGRRGVAYMQPDNQGYSFKYKILPSDITDSNPTADVPDLKGAADTRRPVPGAAKKYSLDDDPKKKGDSASRKWDVSRKIQVTVRNPGGILKSALESEWPLEMCVGQRVDKTKPIVQTKVPIKFPSDDAEGNDDPDIPDEDTDPYRKKMGAGVAHETGYIASYDRPRLIAPHHWGEVRDQKLGVEYEFVEFARVQLWDEQRAKGRTWFRISDPQEIKWDHHMHLIFDQAAKPSSWDDDGSSESKLDP